MTRFALDAASLRLLLDDDRSLAPAHALVAPSLIRSDVLAMLYAEVRSGERAEAEGRALLERLAGVKIRLLGDRVSRATAWRIAARNGWDDIRPAEYLAVAALQADAIVAIDPVMRGAAHEVAVAEYDDLFR